jgi:DnaK suppressor protein
MAKTTRSSGAAKAHKENASNKAKSLKTAVSKTASAKGTAVKNASKPPAKSGRTVKSANPLAAKKPVAKPKTKAANVKTVAKPAAKKAAPPKKSAPAKNVAAKKVVAKKSLPKQAPAAKKAVAPKKVEPKKVAVKKTPATKVASKKAAPIPSKPASNVAAKTPAKPAARKAAVAKQAKGAAKSSGTPAPVVEVKKESPSPASRLFKGKVASATAMVTPRPSSSDASHESSPKKKNLSSSMNKLATKKLENGVTREDGRYALPSTSTISLPKGFRPSSDEEYMNPQHLAYFRNKLRDWRDQLVEESRQTMDNLRDEVRDVGDEAERATRETENSLELRTRDRYRKLISKIDKALRRIEEGSYGFCEETDEEIGVDRLDARPIATLSLDAQERREHLQKQMGD